MQQHGELPCYRHRRAFLGALLAAAFGDLLAVSPEVRIFTERAKHAVGAAEQEPPQRLVSSPGDPLLRVFCSPDWWVPSGVSPT